MDFDHLYHLVFDFPFCFGQHHCCRRAVSYRPAFWRSWQVVLAGSGLCALRLVDYHHLVREKWNSLLSVTRELTVDIDYKGQAVLYS